MMKRKHYQLFIIQLNNDIIAMPPMRSCFGLNHFPPEPELEEVTKITKIRISYATFTLIVYMIFGNPV